MSEYINQLLHYIAHHQNWAWAITFLIAMAESTLIVGLFVPATALLIGMGALIGAGSVDALPIMVAGAAGCVAGDAISYYLGQKIGRRGFTTGRMAKHKRWYARTRLFFMKYGVYTVFIGRFIGPLRSLVAGVAGMLGVDKVKFYIANVLSACIWAPLWIMPGYFGLKSFTNFKQYIHEPVFWTIVSVLVLIIIISGIWFYMRKKNRTTQA